ncbi:MAG: hypothetical protein KDA93_26010 [Planctomycetaceae bacterium]|nr:hypothetical protein [Planctomycetaceae bacterium]
MEHFQIPHGADAFGKHASCACRLCRSKRHAIHRLVDSWSRIPSRWLADVVAVDFDQVEWPLWGTAYIPNNSADSDRIRQLLTESVSDGSSKTVFAEQGWSEVADTGISAIELDGQLILGVPGAGYDFSDGHLAPLYDAMGYQWHDTQ